MEASEKQKGFIKQLESEIQDKDLPKRSKYMYDNWKSNDNARVYIEDLLRTKHRMGKARKIEEEVLQECNKNANNGRMTDKQYSYMLSLWGSADRPMPYKLHAMKRGLDLYPSYKNCSMLIEALLEYKAKGKIE